MSYLFPLNGFKIMEAIQKEDIQSRRESYLSCKTTWKIFGLKKERDDNTVQWEGKRRKYTLL